MNNANGQGRAGIELRGPGEDIECMYCYYCFYCTVMVVTVSVVHVLCTY